MDLREIPPNKRRRLNTEQANEVEGEGEMDLVEKEMESLKRLISPPPSRRRRSKTPEVETPRVLEARSPTSQQPPKLPATPIAKPGPPNYEHERGESNRYVPSPIQLTRIKDLGKQQNVDTVSLEDILGDPMIRECWNFNFLFDIEFVMKKLDPDVKSLMKMNFVHGFWKRDDERRIAMTETAERYENVALISAYIPDPFGTHHSKMLILLRHDDTAQVIIHTANMISRDWDNMTQAVWRSPLLPLQTPITKPPGSQTGGQQYPIGNGERFKVDLFNYFNAYEKKLRSLTEQLAAYDFSAIRAAFIGSAPSRQKPSEAKPSTQTSFGWLGVREILSAIPIIPTEESEQQPNIVIQTSSIATLGQVPTWLTHLQSVLSRSSTSAPVITATASTISKASTFFAKRTPAPPKPKIKIKEPTFNIIFPTASEIRSSLDGYNSGFSIHTKLQSPQQQKQLEYLRPLLCHWRSYSPAPLELCTNLSPGKREAHRGPAAPHIKTYIRFSTTEQKTIDWAMVTSANLSKQAWGEMENKKGECWIQSWETGVVVWPSLYQTGPGESVTMVPVFGRDMPGPEDDVGFEEGMGKVVGFRMPYDLPLESYAKDEVPWCASADHKEPDWKGRIYGGYQPH